MMTMLLHPSASRLVTLPMLSVGVHRYNTRPARPHSNVRLISWSKIASLVKSSLPTPMIVT
jgi:hypothetical protein